MLGDDACLGGRTIEKSQETLFIQVRVGPTLVGGDSDWERREGTFPAAGSCLFLEVGRGYMAAGRGCLLLDLFSVSIIFHYNMV